MQTKLPCISGVEKPTVEALFPSLDVAAAKVAVRNYVALGLRKGPSELLVLTDGAYEQWLNEEAVRFLKERKAERQGVVAEVR